MIRKQNQRSTPLEFKKIEFDISIHHQLRTAATPMCAAGERKEIFITIKTPNPEKNEVTKNFEIEIKLDNLIPQKVCLRDAAAPTVLEKQYPGTNTRVAFFYDQFNQIRIIFDGPCPTLDAKFKAGNKITVTISGHDYDPCTKEITIPPKVNWP